MSSERPFYVGYLPLPAAWKPTVVTWGILWLVGLGTLAVWIAAQQDDPQTGVWDTSSVRSVEGFLEVDPYPVLYVPREDSELQAILLVSELKFGITDRAKPFGAKRVRVRGHFVGQEARAMYEIPADEVAFEELGGQADPVNRRDLGEHTLAGEIADSKCFLGVMKPGYGKTHRACAVRCLSGGITPIFVTRDGEGQATIYVLTGAKGEPIHREVLDYVAEPVQLHGRVTVRGDLLFFAVDLASLQRLS